MKHLLNVLLMPLRIVMLIVFALFAMLFWLMGALVICINYLISEK